MNENIINDEKITEELIAKLAEYEVKLKSLDDRKKELESTLSDLNTKAKIENVSDEVKEKIHEMIGKVEEKIEEVDIQADDFNVKIEEINETLNPIPETIPEPEEIAEPNEPGCTEEVDNIEEIEEVEEKSEKDVRITEFEEKIREFEKKRRELEEKRREIEAERRDMESQRDSSESSEFIRKIDEQINIIERKKDKLNETFDIIDAKMNDDNINEATRDKLEELRDEVEEKIDALDEKLEELQDKKDEFEDEINDKIDEISDRIDEVSDEIDEINDSIDEINDEIEEIENGTVDEKVINDVKKSSGFNDISDLIGRITETVQSALENVKIPEIHIPKLNIRIPEKKSSSGTSETINRPHVEKYNTNFCSKKSGAKIYSVCCQHSHAERAENLIDGDPDYNEKWCSSNMPHKNIKTVNPHWVIVDFGEVKKFNYIKLVKCSPGYGHGDDTGNWRYDASAWHFEVSSNKTDWIEFNRETDDNSAVYEKNIRTLTGRYIKLSVDAGGNDPKDPYHGVRLYDLRVEMRGEDWQNLNLCSNARIESCCSAGWSSPQNLIDDDPAYKTKWHAEYAHEEKRPQPHWVIIDMGEQRTFNYMKIVKASMGKHDLGISGRDMSAWRAEISRDKINWWEFNKETNNQQAVYEKTFAPQTGRYIRFWIDAGENDPSDIKAPARIYDISVEMIPGKDTEKVTFDDIIAIAPFANAQTLDKLVDKLTTEIEDFSKIQSLAPFLSSESLEKLVNKAAVKADFRTISSLAPFLNSETLDRLADNLDEDVDLSHIHSLAPFLSQESLARLVEKNGKVDMNLLKSLAPFLGSEYIEKIISNMI